MVYPITTELQVVESAEEYGRFVAEPLESGYGTTIGNALRRVLLSSLPGAAVTWVRIEGVQHEFSIIPHVKEDTLELLLNVKELRLRALSDRPGRMFLDASGTGEVTAADIQTSPDYEIVNPELHLAMLDAPEARLTVEFNVEQGTGYTQAGSREGMPIGILPLDAIYTPVRRVNYQVESARVGQDIAYDRLILEVWTDGSILPVEAVRKSSQILVDQFLLFTRLGLDAAVLTAGKSGLPVPSGGRYEMPIEDLGLSVRAYNALKRHAIMKVGELLTMSESELLTIRNFGDKSLSELKERLEALGFTEFSNKDDDEEDMADTADMADMADTAGVAEGAHGSNEEGEDA